MELGENKVVVFNSANDSALVNIKHRYKKKTMKCNSM